MVNNQTRFILARAACLLVDAYKATIQEYQEALPLSLMVRPDAPDTYEALKEEAGRGILAVTSAFSETSIYGVSGNITFRVFHDYGHILYDAQFTTEDEVKLATMQWLDLKRHLPVEWLDICHAVYFADTVEQSKYEARTGHFPENQKAFVSGHLDAFFNAQLR